MAGMADIPYCTVVPLVAFDDYLNGYTFFSPHDKEYMRTWRMDALRRTPVEMPAAEVRIDPDAAAEAERITENIKSELLLGLGLSDRHLGPLFDGLKPWVGLAIQNGIAEDDILSVFRDVYCSKSHPQVEFILNDFIVIIGLRLAEILSYKNMSSGGDGISPDFSKFVSTVENEILDGNIRVGPGTPDIAAAYSVPSDTIYIESFSRTSLIRMLDDIVHESYHAYQDIQGPAQYTRRDIEQAAWERGRKAAILLSDFALADGFAAYLNAQPYDYFALLADFDLSVQYFNYVDYGINCAECTGDLASVQYDVHYTYLNWLRDLESELQGIPSDPAKETLFDEFFQVVDATCADSTIEFDGIRHSWEV